jgi:hypothetical protein
MRITSIPGHYRATIGPAASGVKHVREWRARRGPRRKASADSGLSQFDLHQVDILEAAVAQA